MALPIAAVAPTSDFLQGGVKHDSHVLSSEFIVIQSSPTGAVAAGNEIRFNLTANSDYKLESACLRINGAVVTTTAGAAYFPNGLHNLIDSIRVEISGREVVRINNYAEIGNILRAMNVHTPTFWDKMMGFGSVPDRALDSVTARDYKLPLMLFKGVNYFPRATLLNSSDVQIIIQLHAANACLQDRVGTATGATYTFTSIELWIQKVVMDSDFVARVTSAASSGQGYIMSFHEYTPYQVNLGLATTLVQVQIPAKHRSLRRLITVLQPSATLTTITALDRQEDFIQGTALTYQYDVNGRRLPAVPVRVGLTTGADGYGKFLYDSYGSLGQPMPAQVTGLVSYDAFLDNTLGALGKFIITQNLMSEGPLEVDVISGLNTSMADSVVWIELTFTSLSIASRCLTFAETDKVLSIKNGGNVVIYR